MTIKIDSIDMYNDAYNQVFESQKEVSNLGVKYSYKDENGSVTIYVYGDKIRINREGDIRSRQIFDLERETKFRYSTNYLESDLTLITKELIIEGSKIKLEYELYDDKMLVNRIRMSISEG